MNNPGYSGSFKIIWNSTFPGIISLNERNIENFFVVMGKAQSFAPGFSDESSFTTSVDAN